MHNNLDKIITVELRGLILTPSHQRHKLYSNGFGNGLNGIFTHTPMFCEAKQF